MIHKKNDVISSIIFGIICLLIFLVQHILLNNKIISEQLWSVFNKIYIIIIVIIMFIHFYRSEHGFIVQNLIFIIVVFLIYMIGFDFIFDFTFNMMGSLKPDPDDFYSIFHVWYLLDGLIEIAVYSIIMSSLVKLVKIIRKRYFKKPDGKIV